MNASDLIATDLIASDSSDAIQSRHAAPFPGLRPFWQREAELFFGRGEQIDDMLRRLETRRFLAVIGASGSGKSSLVRAGLLPAIESGYLSGAKDQWWIATLRPGDDPYGALAESLLKARDKAVGGARRTDAQATDLAYTAATLRGHQLGLVTALHDLHAPDDADVLVLVDQFEELFRFRRLQEQRARQQADRAGQAAERIQEEAAAFVNLLLASSRQTQRRIYVVLTMRSDYLGDCDAFLGLPEAINDSQFLTPRMTRDQLRDSIEGPLETFGLRQRADDWESGLVNTILNDVGADPDQLPLMQHALLQTWQIAEDRRRRAAQDSPSGARQVPRLTQADYRAAGGFQSALSNHADHTLARLRATAANEQAAAERERIARRMFCLLCDFEPGGRITRRPATLQELLDVTQSPWPEVRAVVAEFAGAGRNFVVVDTDDLESLGPDNSLDISHEALLRQWGKLRDQWLPAELESAAFYQRLADQVRRWKADPKKAGLWDTPDLETAVQWRDDERPSEAWANRYCPGLAACHEFLDASLAAQKRRLDKEAETEASLRQSAFFRVISVFLGVALVVGVIVLMRMQVLSDEANQQRIKAARASKSASKEARLARAQQCAAVSGSTLPRNPVLATILAAEALRGLAPTDDVPQSVEQALRDAVADCTGRPLIGHSGDVDKVAFDPTERWLATTSADEILLWDLSVTPDQTAPIRLPVPLDPHGDGKSEKSPRYGMFIAVAFDPQGKRLRAVQDSSLLLEWEVGQTPRLVRSSHLFSIPKTARVFETPPVGLLTRNATLLMSPPPPKDEPEAEGQSLPHVYFTTADFDLSTRRLATCDNNGRVNLWTLPVDDTTRTVASFVCEDANTVKFVAGRPTLITAGDVVQTWDYGDGDGDVQLGYTLASPKSARFTHVAADSKMRFIAAADHDLSGRRAQVFLWDLAPQSPARPGKVGLLLDAIAYYSHESNSDLAGLVTRLAFAPDGRVLASSSLDGTIRMLPLVDLAPSADGAAVQATPQLRRFAGPVAGMAFDPRSGLLVSDDEHTVVAHLVDSERRSYQIGAVEFIPTNRSLSPSSHMAVSSRGRWLVRGDRLWDLLSPVDGVSLVGEGTLAFAQASTGQWAAALCQDSEAPYVQLWSIDNVLGPVPTHRLTLPEDYLSGRLPSHNDLRFDRGGSVLALLYRPINMSSAERKFVKDPTRLTQRLAIWNVRAVTTRESPDLAPITVSLARPDVWDVCEGSVVHASFNDPTLRVTPLKPQTENPSGDTALSPEEVFAAATVTDLQISPNGLWMAAFHEVPLKADPGRGGNQVTIWRRESDGWHQAWTSRASPVNAERNWFGQNGSAIALGNRWLIVTPRGDGEPQDGIRALRLDDDGPHEFVIMPEVRNVVAIAVSANERRLLVGFTDSGFVQTRFKLAELDPTPRAGDGDWESRGIDRFSPVWSPDGNWLATSNYDSVELFPINSSQTGVARASQRRFRLTASAESSAAIGFSPDGNSLFTVTDYLIKSWPTQRESLNARARRAAGRNLFESEWNDYLPGDKRTGEETFSGLGKTETRIMRESLRTNLVLSDPRVDGVIRYRIANLPRIANANALLAEAWAAWAALGGITPEPVKDDEFHVVIRTGPIDGPGGQLALASTGPPSRDRELVLRFDSAEKWTAEVFYLTAAHEIGHILGLHHSPQSGQLMSNVLDPSIRVPQDEDKARFREIWKERLTDAPLEAPSKD